MVRRLRSARHKLAASVEAWHSYAMKDGKETIFFYAYGSDLHDVADTLRARFRALQEGRTWTGDVWLVDDLFADDPSLKPGDLPDWNLGLNIAFEGAPTSRPANWFGDIAATIHFLHALAAETGREFVIGASFEGSQVVEDLFFVDGRTVLDLDEVREGLGG